MRFSHAILAVLLLAVAGCGGGKAQPTTRGCSSLTAADIERITGSAPHELKLNPTASARVRCSTVFFAGATQLVVSITERDGGAKALSRLRAMKIAERGRASVRPAVGLGDGAFLAEKRILGFRQGDRVVTLETGFDKQGKRLLTAAQLVQLAHVIAPRL
jgi:hypothetical protein